MTTIAAKEVNGKVKIAWDSQVTYGGSAEFGAVKVQTINEQLTLGGAGHLRYLNLVFRTRLPGIHPVDLANPNFDGLGWILDCAIPEWMEAVKEEKKRLVDEDSGVPSGVLIVILGGKIYSVGEDFSVTQVEDYCAVGSGSKYARTAMYLGKNPKQAVEIAADLDIYTGGKIKELAL